MAAKLVRRLHPKQCDASSSISAAMDLGRKAVDRGLVAAP